MSIVDESPARPAEEGRDSPPPALRPELQHALRREIEQAIEPILTDLREQSVRTVRQQVDEAQPTERGAERSEPTARSETSELSRPVLQFLDQAGTQWVRARVEDGRDALCSESLRVDVRGSIERTFHPLLEAGLDLVPGEATRRELQQESKHALDELIEDALDRFCSEGILAELQQHAEAAIHAFVRFDVATMLREAWEAIRALLRAILAAAQDEWQRLLHLLLHVLLKATQEMIGTLIKDGLATLVAVPVEEIEEKAESAKETVEEKSTELKERLEELRDRVKEEVGKVKERVAEGLQSAVKDGTPSEKFGRPPTGRPPSVRPPSGRPPSGRPPSGLPPSGRPPSMTRRGT
jgi:hypothetical protein